jgi:hypothetical protein
VDIIFGAIFRCKLKKPCINIWKAHINLYLESPYKVILEKGFNFLHRLVLQTFGKPEFQR